LQSTFNQPNSSMVVSLNSHPNAPPFTDYHIHTGAALLSTQF